MERLKNFFYGKNDILLALIILVIATIIIGFRVKTFLDYPKTLTVVEDSVESILKDTSNQSSQDTPKEE